MGPIDVWIDESFKKLTVKKSSQVDFFIQNKNKTIIIMADFFVYGGLIGGFYRRGKKDTKSILY